MVPNNLERIIPDCLHYTDDIDRVTLEIHLERYRYAGKFLRKGLVLDIACGVGYGAHNLITNFLDKIDQIVAVDLDSSSIEYAQKRYYHERIRFVCADATLFRLPTQVQTVISLETIEHLTDPEKFIHTQVSNLQIGGFFIASVPITPSVDLNPHHKTDFTESSFIKLMESNGLRIVDKFIQVQMVNPVSLLIGGNQRMQGIRRGLFSYYLDNPSKAFLRMKSLVRDGFRNKYLVAAFAKYQ